MEKLLSICIPTYNRKSYLERSINALLPQLRDDIEVLISNNCSPDDTDEYCKTLDSRIIYHKQSENIGSDGNFLWLMDNAKGKYIILLSDDDYLEDGAVNRLINFLNGKEIGLGIINSRCQMKDGRITDLLYGVGEDTEFSEEEISDFLETIGVQLTFISGLVFNRDLIKKVQDKKQYNNTNLLQTCVAFKCLEFNKKTALIKTVACVAENDNSSGYNFYKVFVKNWHDVLFKVGLSAGLPKKALIKVYNRTLGNFVLVFLIKDRLNTIPFESNNRLKYLAIAWHFKKAWTRIYPALIMPKFLLKKIAHSKNLI